MSKFITNNWIILTIILVVIFFILAPYLFKNHKLEHPFIHQEDTVALRYRKLDTIEQIKREIGIEKVIAKMRFNDGYWDKESILRSGFFTDGISADLSIYKMLALGLIRPRKETSIMELTDKGFAFSGFENEHKMQYLQFRKMELDVKNSERIFATYWWTFGIATASLSISFFLLILKIKGNKD